MENKGGKSIGFTGLLTIALIILKLCGVINWSWLAVFSPVIISTLIVVSVIVMWCIFLGK